MSGKHRPVRHVTVLLGHCDNNMKAFLIYSSVWQRLGLDLVLFCQEMLKLPFMRFGVFDKNPQPQRIFAIVHPLMLAPLTSDPE